MTGGDSLPVALGTAHQRQEWTEHWTLSGKLRTAYQSQEGTKGTAEEWQEGKLTSFRRDSSGEKGDQQ